MASFLKALLVVGVILILLAIIAGVGGYYWYSKHGRQFVESTRKARDEGVEFGEETDDQGCLAEALARHKRLSGFGDAIAQNVFLAGCFSSSETTDGFCDDVPKRLGLIATATWQTRKCAEAGFSDPFCRQIFAQVQQYCESGLSRPEGGAPGKKEGTHG